MKWPSLFFLLFPFFAGAQKIAENKVDDFTHAKIRRTTWNDLDFKFSGPMIVRTRINQIDSLYYLEVKYMCHGACSMRQGDVFMLKFSSDSIISLPNPELKLSCIGCGSTGLMGSNALGLDLSFNITHEQIKYFSENKIVKIRLYLSDGYNEDSPSSSDAKIFMNQAKIML